MKHSIKKLIALLIAIFLMSATLPAQKPKQKLAGLWHMASGKVNGKPVPAQLTNRIWIFNADNTFEGKKFINGDYCPYNTGISKQTDGKRNEYYYSSRGHVGFGPFTSITVHD